MKTLTTLTLLFVALLAGCARETKRTGTVQLISWKDHRMEYFRPNGEVQVMDTDDDAWPMIAQGATVDVVYQDGRYGGRVHIIELVVPQGHK